MQNAFNTAAPSEGKRNGVSATEIADTLEAMFSYFDQTLQNNPDVLKAVVKEAGQWRGQVAGLRGADQKTLNDFFGQPSGNEVRAILAAQGTVQQGDDDRAYDAKFEELRTSLVTDKGCYWPGKVVPTIGEYRKLLKFDAYREKLGGDEKGPARALLDRIDAFDGGFGEKHLAGGGVGAAITEYINTVPRHPSEVFTQPENVYVDYLNAFNHTYSNYVTWKPSEDMTRVTAQVSCGTWTLPEERNRAIAYEKVKFEAALERGGIDADVSVAFGKTYNDDILRVSMSMQDYTQRYVPIKCGKIQIDLSRPGKNDNASLDTCEFYPGYEPGKQAFFDVGDLLVSAKTMAALDADFPEERLAAAAEAVRFGRGTKMLTETTEKIPVAPGQKGDFVRIKRVGGDNPGNDIREFEGRYYSGCDIHNKISGSLRLIEAAVNGHTAKDYSAARAQDVLDDASFKFNDDMYLPKGDKSYQIALHMKYTYGVDYTWVIKDDKAKAKAAGKDKFVIFTSKLDPSSRDIALADLNEKLKQDWKADDVYAATILRKKIKVSKPLSLAPKAP